MVVRLEERLNALARGEHVPRVVILEGPSGIGKSRIVREFYRALCRDLEGGPRREGDAPSGDGRRPYWPELEEGTRSDGVSVDPLPARKFMGPAHEGFTWVPEAEPAFAWWDLQCERIDRAQADGATYMIAPSCGRGAIALGRSRSSRSVAGMPSMSSRRR